jgi:hypothetical protein
MNERLKELAFEAGFTITPCGLFEAEDTNLERFADLVRADEREAITQGYKDMLSALRAIVAVAETEKHSFSMHNIKDCANIAIKQAKG